MPTNSSAPKKAAAATLATAASAALLLASLLSAAPPARAAGTPTGKAGGSTSAGGAGGGTSASTHPGAPTVGGARLGRSGTQVSPKKGAPALPKGLTGKSWLVADAESGEVLAAHDAHRPLPPASTLKMLFADTVLPKLPKDEKHTVKPSDLAGMGEGSSLVGVKENLSYTVHDLWLGVFLRSGNDAVHVLAAMNGGVPKTVRDMQQHAKELNADDTHVVTPDGYDEPGQVSSAYDLTLFARAGLQNPDFREYCSTATAKFPGDYATKNGKKVRQTFAIQNTDRLLTGDYDLKPYPGIAGVKNGSTTNAGSTYTGVAQHGNRVLLVTVMNPQNKQHNEVYRESEKLFDWGFKAAGSVSPIGTLVKPGTGTTTDKGKHHQDKKTTRHTQASASSGGSGGLETAFGIVVGSLVVLGAIAYAVNRRWPLPELVRRRPRG